MTSYTYGDDENESIYESDGSEFSYKDELGRGAYDRARLFKSKSGKEKVILAPKDKVATRGDFNQSKSKCEFFKQFYEQKSYFFRTEDTYRLAVPRVNGACYKDYLDSAYEAQEANRSIINLNLAKSLFLAVKKIHQAGLVYLDIKSNNIFYNPQDKQSHFVDGGLATPMQNKLPDLFLLETIDDVSFFRNKYKYLAPECWDVKPVYANTAMDIYSAGFMLTRLLVFQEPKESRLKNLLYQCQCIQGESRPSLEQIFIELEAIQTDYRLKTRENKRQSGIFLQPAPNLSRHPFSNFYHTIWQSILSEELEDTNDGEQNFFCDIL